MRPRTRALFLLAGVCFAAGFSASAVEWPTAQAELESNFGRNDRGRASVGMVFKGDDAVRACDAGEVVFAVSGDQGNGFPSPLGDWTAIDHGNGMVSVYGRMQESQRTAFPATLVEKGAVLGRSGASGWSDSVGFYFSIYDRKERRWVNPTMIAPERNDERAPAIRSVSLEGRDGKTMPFPQTRTVRQGSYRVIVDAADSETVKRGGDLAPQRIMCLVNGNEQGSLHLETIRAEDGQLIVYRMEPAPAAQAYRRDGAFDLGEVRLARGRTTIEVIARDAVGNERTLTFGVTVE